MADKYINLNELSITTQALLKKINEQAELKVDKDEVSSYSSDGSLIASIGDVDIYNGISGSVVNDVRLDGNSIVYGGVADLYSPSVYVQTAASGSYLYTINGVGFNTKSLGLLYIIPKSTSGMNATYDYTPTNTINQVIIDGTARTPSGAADSKIVFDRFGNQQSNNYLYGDRFYSWIIDDNNKLRFYEIGLARLSDLPSKVSDLTNDSGYQTESQVNTLIGTAIGGINQFNVAIVQTLPTTNIDAHTIYFVPQQNAQTANSYEEWMYINSQWEMIGTTSIDLSGYVPTSRTVNGKALSSDISLDYQDVGALSSSTSIPDSTSDLTNDSGFITSADIPVTDVQTEDEISVVSNGIATIPDEVFVVTFFESQGMTNYYYQTDKTFQQCSSAMDAGKVCVLISDSTSSNKFFGIALVQTASKILFARETFTISSSGSKIYAKTFYELSSNGLTPYKTNGNTASQIAFNQYVTNSLPSTAGTAGQILVSTGSGGLGAFNWGDIPVTDVQNSSGISLVSNGVATIPAIPTVPTNVSSFTNDAGYLTLATLPIYDGTVI